MINVISFMHFQDENKFSNIYELYRNGAVMEQPGRWLLTFEKDMGSWSCTKRFL